MKLLILGGTKFLGRHLAEAALAAGHAVTLFHRGQTNPDLFPEAEHVHGDRDGGLERLAGLDWDACVDTSGYVPRVVGASARFLAGHVAHYTFVSSISVYSTFRAGMDESAPVAELEDPAVEEITGTTYGGLKALCEREVEQAFPGRALLARSGLIVGPFDPTDRFTYWVRRIAVGGRVLVPGPPGRPLQVIHPGDMAGWFLKSAVEGVAGTFNVTWPGTPFTMEELFRTCREASGSNAEPVWVDEDFLAGRGLEFWSELPLCVEAAERGLMEIDVSRARAAGLESRSLVRIVRETLAWDMGRPPGTTMKAGLRAEQEAELLAAWSARSGT